MKALLKNRLKSFRSLMFVIRIFRAFKTNGFFLPMIKKILHYGFSSKEISSFTYNLTPFNEMYLIHAVALSTGKSSNEIEMYFNEIKNDIQFNKYILYKISTSEYKNFKDQRCDFGSRIAWYAVVRALKAKVVVENGVEIGYTAALLCRAIQINIEEGYSGRYFGFDINCNAGYLVKDRIFNSIVSFTYGDTINSIKLFNEKIDFYFSDGERTPEYEYIEFNTLLSTLSENGIIVSNKMAFSSELANFSRLNNRKFLYFKEEPMHWYNGSALGISFT